MTTKNRIPSLQPALAAIAAALIAGPALAQQVESITRQTAAPENSISVGAGFASGDQKDRARWGMFNGLREHDTNGLVDFNYFNRGGDSGRWLVIEGKDLALDSREASIQYRQLGDFKLRGYYTEITRHDPRTINTSLTGSGTTSPTVSLLATPGTGSDLNLELKRQALGLEGVKKWGNFEFELNFKNEDKKGARQWGMGFACSTTYDRGAGVCSNSGTPTTLLMLPEPVDSTIRQIDAKLNYNGEKLKLSGGYYGNFYDNNVGSLKPTWLGTSQVNWNGTVSAIDANLRNNFVQQGLALWPDSQAHQLFLGGNYAFTPHTRMTFKVAYTHATQNEGFGGMGLNAVTPLTATLGGTTRSSLGGEVNTTRAQLGFSSAVSHDLHVHGDVSYEARDNKTPVDRYNVQVNTNNANPALVTYNVWTNSAMSPKKFDAKLEANYRLPYEIMLVGGYKYEREDTGAWTPTDAAGGISALRQKTDSNSFRLEARKTMSETFTGSLAVVEERRTGASSWLRPLTLPLTGVINASQDCAAGANITTLAILNTAGSGCVYGLQAQIPYSQKDMQRERVRATGSWTPIDRFSLQGYLDVGTEDYRGPTTAGLSNSKFLNFTLDAVYDIAQNWKANAFYTRSQRSMDMGHSSDYNATLKDYSNTIGAGFSGAPVDRFRIGADLMYIHDTLQYNISADPAITAANQTLLNSTGGLPDVKYKLLRLRLYGDYLINKASSIRVDYVFNHTFFNEWTYDGLNNGQPFLFSDNTTISAKQTQNVNFIGARYIYRFQ